MFVGIVDAQDKLPAVLAGEQPVEQSRAHAADVQEAGRAWGEACANHDHLLAGEEPVEKTREHAADAQETGRAEAKAWTIHEHLAASDIKTIRNYRCAAEFGQAGWMAEERAACRPITRLHRPSDHSTA